MTSPARLADAPPPELESALAELRASLSRTPPELPCKFLYDDRGSALFHYAQLAPAVDFARIDEVLLIVGEGAHDVAALFPPAGG